MRFSKTVLVAFALSFLMLAGTSAFAESAAKGKAKAYTEEEFLKSFSGKSCKVVAEKLGMPVKREQSVKPTNASSVLGRPTDDSKPVNIEMWYYGSLVKSDAKNKWKTTELTFVNDRCMNIAFFNSK